MITNNQNWQFGFKVYSLKQELSTILFDDVILTQGFTAIDDKGFLNENNSFHLINTDLFKLDTNAQCYFLKQPAIVNLKGLLQVKCSDSPSNIISLAEHFPNNQGKILSPYTYINISNTYVNFNFSIETFLNADSTIGFTPNSTPDSLIFENNIKYFYLQCMILPVIYPKNFVKL